MNGGMKAGTASYRVVREGFLEEVIFNLRMKNEKEPAMWRLVGKGFRWKEKFKQLSKMKEDWGVFEVLREDQSGWDERPVLEQEEKWLSGKVLVVISREKSLLRVCYCIPHSLNPNPKKMLSCKRVLSLVTILSSIVLEMKCYLFFWKCSSLPA